MLTVCVNQRAESFVPSCGRRGGLEIAEALAAEIERRNLPVTFATIKCLGLCERGPNVRLSPSNSWFHDVAPDDVPELLDLVERCLPLSLQSKETTMSQSLPPDAFREAMEAKIRGRSHADFPIVKAIAEGTATREQIGYLGVLFYHFTKETPQVLSTIHSRCSDPAVRRRIMDTLIDEDTELRCGSKSHPALALDFATRFTGLTEDEVKSHPVPACIGEMSAYRYKVAREMPVVIALGNSGIASESHAPQMVRLISDGLREHYGVKDEDQESWIVHIEGDEEHSETAFKAVLEFATTAELQEKMFWCIDRYLTHWAAFWTECEKGDLRKPVSLVS